MNPENIITFIASWKEDYGTKVIELYPSDETFDYSIIATQIIRTYQFFYKKDSQVSSSNITFNLPLVNISNRAIIFLESIEEKDKINILMVVILIPDYFPEDRLNVFESLIQNIGMEYLETKSQLLGKYFDQILEKFNLEQQVHDSDIYIEEDYKVTNAL